MRCAHFGTCGGCATQDQAYDAQLAAKKAQLKRAHGQDVEIVGSPEQFGYRNRMDFAFGPNGELGMRKSGDRDTYVNIKECLLCSSWVNDVLAFAREQLQGLPFFDGKIGLLRYLVTRDGFNTNERMVSFTTSSQFSPEQEQTITNFCSAVSEKFNITSTHWQISDDIFDDSRGITKQFWGKEYITEKLGEKEFIITPTTFFQTNTKAAEGLYQEVFSHVPDNTKLLDLFCGVGSIGIYASEKANSLFGVELVEESIRLAKENAQLNNITNAQFVAVNAREFLTKPPLEAKDCDTIIVDPPRVGLQDKAVRGVCRLKPKKIIYVSCNPESQAEDLRIFKAHYNVTSIKGFDMFPHTPHVECVVVLEKK